MGRGGRVEPLLGLYKEGWVPFFFTQFLFETSFSDLSSLCFSLLEWTSLVWSLHLVGVSPPYARRRAAGIGIRLHLLSAALLVRSPEGTSGTPYAYKPARHYTCGAPSSLR